MKVLFAVNDEKSSAAIVKKYQKEYKEIISYKNVYYFNAILKEIQRDKTYDRIVISEDLEEFSSTSYEQQDKYIFERLDNISDEASNAKGDDIQIIVICSERRVKSEELLVKLFGIGIYDAIIGKDRSIDEVCRLINKPRTKKEAKMYYKIDAEDVNYQTESENEVSEEEMQNILNHFARLGKNEERYVESFNNIVGQYNEKQLRTIIAILPANVKAILESNSIEYQKLVMNGGKGKNRPVSSVLKRGPSEKLISFNSNKIDVKNSPIVVPTALNKNVITKSANKQNVTELDEWNDVDDEIYEEDDVADDFEDVLENNTDDNYNDEINIENEIEDIEDEVDAEDEVDVEDGINNIDMENVEAAKETTNKRRGRPRKTPIQVENVENNKPKKRGRPRKIQSEDMVDMTLPGLNEKDDEEEMLPGFEDEKELVDKENDMLPGFDQEEDSFDENTDSLPGLEENDQEYEEGNDILPGMETIHENDSTLLPGIDSEEEYSNKYNDNSSNNMGQTINNNNNYNRYQPLRKEPKKEYIENIDIRSLLTDKNKIITFIGTSKNGVSFTVNNIAEFLSEEGIDVAILDTTQNKNSYYIYTQNEDELRSRAAYSITNLLNGDARGIKIKENLTIYTNVPNQDDNIENYGKILETLVKNHSVILIDCDYNTPYGYFENAQEIYLVQTMDILTIQPLTAFLRELKSRNILSDEKIRIIINKSVRLKRVGAKDIIGGMAYYNDPEMSFMTELFNKDTVKYIEVPFYQDIYEKYLDGVVECDISIKKYSKDFMFILKNLAAMVYPESLNKNSGYNGYNYNKKNKTQYSNGFSSSVNNTLNNMKKNY